MSRIPTTDWLRIAEDARNAQSYSEKVALAAKSVPKPAAALVALSHEASAVIARLADLVERGSNGVLIDKAAIVLARWNEAVREAETAVGGSSRRT